jgi:bacteriocin-like protein
MKENNLEITQKNDKLFGGFKILSKEKLKSINGGLKSNTEVCTNKTTECNTTNSTHCTNWGDRNCATSVNSKFCQNNS